MTNPTVSYACSEWGNNESVGDERLAGCLPGVNCGAQENALRTRYA
jgi:hypothetical protein